MHVLASALQRPSPSNVGPHTPQDDLQGDEEPRYEQFNLPIIHDPRRNVLEESVNFHIGAGSHIANRYQIIDFLGSGVFSLAVQCVELATGGMVCVKIIRNNKDFFDQSLGEIKLLKRLNSADPHDAHHVLRMLDYFYFREHLFIVTELLRDNLYELYKYIANSDWTPYFSLARIRGIAHQCLTALDFIHRNGMIHCDLKPENILIKSLSRCMIKVVKRLMMLP